MPQTWRLVLQTHPAYQHATTLTLPATRQGYSVLDVLETQRKGVKQDDRRRLLEGDDLARAVGFHVIMYGALRIHEHAHTFRYTRVLPKIQVIVDLGGGDQM